METSRACKTCRDRSLVRDEVSGSLICSSCGLVQEFDNFDAQIGGISGPQGTFIRVGSTGTGSALIYREKKIFEAQKLIDDLMYKLNLDSKSNEVKSIINNITKGEFGQGDWFPILIGACAYVVMRRDNKSLPMAEVALVIGCDIYELNRMQERVVNFLDLNLPEFDIVLCFERAVRNSPILARVEGEILERMRKQGIFLIQCAVKWFLTTGRRPLPMVAAMLVFVAELNQVDVRIEDMAKEVHAAVVTSKLRYKELLETLVKVAQALPWGKDVTIKNILKNMPFVIQYMEIKSTLKPGEKKRDLEHVGLEMEDVVSDCLGKYNNYGTIVKDVENDSQYFEVEDRSGFLEWGIDLGKLKISPQCLSVIYSKFLTEIDRVQFTEATGKVQGQKRRRGFELRACQDWWNEKSELSKKLLLKKILEKDIGLDVMPPSFVNNCMAYKQRREKINAAKLRINKIMHPSNMDSVEAGNSCFLECLSTGKKRKKRRADEVDWEDFIIETLLLHQVKEDEIEKGHYNTLLDLHVFNSGVM